jgi:RimJ/RimL family protein N-acetyltransferase
MLKCYTCQKVISIFEFQKYGGICGACHDEESKEGTIRISRISTTDLYIVVAIQQAKPIGFFGLSPTNEVYGLFIDPEYRNQGYGKEVFRLLQEMGHRTVVVTSEENVPMQKVLESLGFKKWLKYEAPI